MIKHYFTLMYRNVVRAKGYFLINLVGLTTGLTCALLIYLWVDHEYSMDNFHEKNERLYQMMEHQKYADHIMTTASTPGILAPTLKEEFPEVEYAATTSWVTKYTLSVGDHNVKAEGHHAREDYFNIFSYNLIAGDVNTALKDKFSIVISKDLAQKLFGTVNDVIGKTVELQHEKTFRVTGIFEGTPPTSSIQFDFVIPFEIYIDENDWVLRWGNNGPSTFIVLKDGADPDVFESKIGNFIKGKNPESNVTLFMQRYEDRYLYGSFENGQLVGGRIEYVQLFSIIAVFILLIACINFMNLATARASKKAKEVGIKKSVGAQRRSLVFQYLSESLVTTLISLMLAVGVVYLFLPQFNLITEKALPFDIIDLPLALLLIGIALITGLLAGSYPALYLSRFKPSTVLKGEAKGSMGELWARKGLVVFQFLITVILIASVLVVYDQINFVQSKNLGYKKDHLIKFPIEGKLKTSLETFLEEARRVPGVISAASTSHSFMGRNNNTSGLSWEGKNPEELILFENVRVSHGLLETLDVALAEGRFFSKDFAADSSKIVLNETAIRIMNMKDPIGKKIRLWDTYDLEIIGVVKDFHFQSLHDQVNPLFFWLSPENTWHVMIRLEGGKEKEALAALTTLYSNFNEGFAFDYQFQDQEYAKLYKSEQRVAVLSGYFASVAILISCLGLFGLAAFTAERRTKEIGIRKALGSSSTNIVMLLSGDFTKMVLVSIALGLPVSYWLLNQWLQRFAFHIDLNVWYFIVAGGTALFIALATVSTQAIKASRVNPVNSLRSE